MRQQLRALAHVAMSPVATLRVSRWAWSAHHELGRSLRSDGIDAADRVPSPPPMAANYRGTVSAVLGLSGASCLVRSAVLRRWDSVHDRPRPLVIGVARQGDGSIIAHAWLDGDAGGEGFVELYRRPPG